MLRTCDAHSWPSVDWRVCCGSGADKTTRRNVFTQRLRTWKRGFSAAVFGWRARYCQTWLEAATPWRVAWRHVRNSQFRFADFKRVASMRSEKVMVKIGFFYSATYTVNNLSSRALYNLGSGSWSTRVDGAAAQMRPSIACTNGQWERWLQLANTTAPINHNRLSPRKHSPDGATRAHPITAYYSFIVLERMKGWVCLVGWPTGLARDKECSPTKECKDRRSTTVLRIYLPNNTYKAKYVKSNIVAGRCWMRYFILQIASKHVLAWFWPKFS